MLIGVQLDFDRLDRTIRYRIFQFFSFFVSNYVARCKEFAMKLGNLVLDQWLDGDGDGTTLNSAVSGKPLAHITSDGMDFAAVLAHARNVGGSNLRKMTFHQRGEMLKALAQYLMEHKKELYALSTETGATKGDSWVDIDGGISTLFVFSSKGRREMPNDHVYLDGPPEALSRNGTFVGQHICTPKLGAAVHINAFNFPCWGMLEKLAPTLLAGVPAIVKPASSTAYLTELMVRQIKASGILPDGALQLICGGVGDLFDHLNCQDTIAFTGSKSTAEFLQQHPRVVSESVAFTAETDSLNSSILGPDALPGTPEFDLFVNNARQFAASSRHRRSPARLWRHSRKRLGKFVSAIRPARTSIWAHLQARDSGMKCEIASGSCRSKLKSCTAVTTILTLWMLTPARERFSCLHCCIARNRSRRAPCTLSRPSAP
jgi:hypothetical protein